MPVLFQIMNILADLTMFIFVIFYLYKLNNREKELEKKAGKIDSDYHQIVDSAAERERKILEEATKSYHQILDNALARERKILEEATATANQIIAGAQYVNKTSKDTIDQALQKMMLDVQQETLQTARDFLTSYQIAIKQIANNSLNNFQSISREMELDLQKQIKEFQTTLLPNLEKDVQEYKQARLNQTEHTITTIIQKASQQVLNKTIPLEDHQKLLIDSLERAKKEGVFD